jgi:hypothetical protein
MNVYFEDEEKLVEYIKNDNIHKLKRSLSKITNDIVICRLFELSLKMLKPLSVKLLYYKRPLYGPANPLTILTSIFMNYKESRNTKEYRKKVDCAIDIFNFLAENSLINRVDYDWACEWASYEDMTDLVFLK